MGATRGVTFMSFSYSHRFLFLLWVVCLSITSNATVGSGQTSTATLTGIVQDATGAVVPNVSIAVKNTDWNTSYSTRTSEVGNYVVPALNPGNYSVVATLPGFKRFVREGVVLQV